MIDHLIIALLLLAIAGVLIFLGVPKKVDNIRAVITALLGLSH